MGLHAPFGYCNEEIPMLKTFINLLDDFCSGCHTYDDYKDHCKGCHIGQLIYACKDYLSDIHLMEEPYLPKKKLSKEGQQENKTYRKIMKLVKKIEPEPFFNSTMVSQDEPSVDQLEELRWCLKELEHYKSRMKFNITFRGNLDADEKKAIKLAQIAEISDIKENDD